jgi:hypothetical protein
VRRAEPCPGRRPKPTATEPRNPSRDTTTWLAHAPCRSWRRWTTPPKTAWTGRNGVEELAVAAAGEIKHLREQVEAIIAGRIYAAAVRAEWIARDEADEHAV